MKRLVRFGLLLVCLGFVFANTAYAQDADTDANAKPGTVGIRAGIGTDITGGIAYGVQLNYTLNQNRNGIEMGLAVFGGHFEEESDNGSHVYKEETDVLVIGALVNYLFRWSLDVPGPYFLAGIGVGAFSVEWVESSDTDTSLGPPLAGGGSMMSEDGTTAGLLLNFGIGHRFNKAFDLRAQIPVLFVSGTDERDGKVVPMITVTAGLSF